MVRSENFWVTDPFAQIRIATTGWDNTPMTPRKGIWYALYANVTSTDEIVARSLDAPLELMNLQKAEQSSWLREA
jgi:hypothetical protein